MNSTTPARGGRALGLLVRHWACNMTLVHDQGSAWPGFGYTPDEQTVLRTLARRVPSFEFTTWMAFVVLLALVTFAGFALLAAAQWAGNGANDSPESASGTAFLLSLGVAFVVSLAVGFPAAMLAASVATGRLFNVSDAALPDAAARDHFLHKLSFQLARVALLGSAVIVALCLWLPDRVWLLTRCVVPVLGPAVGLSTLLYYRCRSQSPVPRAPTASDG